MRLFSHVMKSITWKQCPDMTKAFNWDVKHKIKHTITFETQLWDLFSIYGQPKTRKAINRFTFII